MARARSARTRSFRGVQFRSDKNITSNLEKNSHILLPIKEKVDEAADAARDFAPVLTGAYRDSIKSDSVMVMDGINRKSVYRLLATDFKAGWIEFGTSRMPAFAVLRRAIESVGLHFISDISVSQTHPVKALKTIQVRSHMRGGKKVRGYSRTVKG